MALRILLALMLLSTVVEAQNITNLTVYMPTWVMRPLDVSDYGNPADRFDFTGVTHVVLFMDGNVQTTSPYYGPRVNNAAGIADSLEFYHGVAGSGGDNMGQLLITEAHARGVKVLLTIQAVDPGEGWNFVAADSTRSAVFADAAADFAYVFGADGFEINVEDWITPITGDVNMFARVLRRALDARYSPTVPIIFTSASRLDYNRYDSLTTAFAIDMHNLQCYNMQATWDTGIAANRLAYQTNLTRGDWVSTYPNWQWSALDFNWVSDPVPILESFTSRGMPASKIGIGFGVYGYISIGSGIGPGSPEAGHFQDLGTFEMLDLVNYGGTYFYDTVRAAPYIQGTASGTPPYWFLNNGEDFFAVFEDSLSLWQKIRWLDSMGVGGIMLYDLKGTHRSGTTDSTSRNPEVGWTASAIQNFSGAPSAPSAQTNAASSITSTTATLNGLVSANGASTTITFEWDTDTGAPYASSGAATPSPTSSDGVSVTRALTSLSPSTTYYFRVVAVNSEGTTNGSELNFTTDATPVAAAKRAPFRIKSP